MQFQDIVGQRVLINSLTEVIDSGRVSHAQMFCGPTASGSLALAIAYAQYLNCQHRIHYDVTTSDGQGEPPLRADSCGECPSCRKFQQLTHSDLHFVFPNATTDSVKSRPSSNDFQEEFRAFLTDYHQTGSLDEWYAALGIENKQGMIRELDADYIVKSLAMKSYEGAYKVLIVWMAEKMNDTAANKLLKTLEEPLGNTLMILVTEDTRRMLSTILSRTQLVKVPEVSSQMVWPQEFSTMFVSWMRLLFKLNMQSLSAQVEQLAAMKREQQKQFLQYVMETIRQCFLCTVAGVPCHLHSGDEKFDTAFPNMVTVRNVEQMCSAVNDMLYAIERNAAPKIAFMQLSFTLSKLIKKR